MSFLELATAVSGTTQNTPEKRGCSVAPKSAAPVRECPPGRGGTVLPDPRRRRTPSCAPCSDELFEAVNQRIIAGEVSLDACRAVGVPWAAWREAGALEHNVERYRGIYDIQNEHRRAEIEATGKALLDTARAELPSRTESGETDGKPYQKEVFERSATAAQAGAALLAPDVHGRSAGRAQNNQAVQVIVNPVYRPGVANGPAE